MIETVVIGGGLMGSAAAWQLASRGCQVLLIEKQCQVYDQGSSYGQARISRALGIQNDLFSYLQQLSIKETEKLIDYLNENDRSAHKMTDVYSTSPVTYLYNNLTSEHLRQFNATHHDYALNPNEALNKFGMQVPNNIQVVREFMEYSGTINPTALIKKMHQAILLAGGAIKYESQVRHIEEKDGTYTLEVQNSGRNEHIPCSRIVCAAGPYSGSLLKDIAPYFANLIEIQRLQLAFFKPDPGQYKRLSSSKQEQLEMGFPVIELNNDFFYAMKECDDVDGIPILKVGGHFRRQPISNLDQSWKKPVKATEIQWSKDRLAHYLRLLKIPLAVDHLQYQRGYSCTYSLTNSEIPYVTPLPDKNGNLNSDIVVIAGLSGVGAKAALAYGLFATNMLMGESLDDKFYDNAVNQMGADRLSNDLSNTNKSGLHPSFHASLGIGKGPE